MSIGAPEEDALESFQLGDWWIVPSECRLRRAGEERHLFPQQMDVLVFLARRAGKVISKDKIFDAVWHETAVQEGALPRCVSEIRKALGDDALEPRYIQTIRKRGYRVVAPVVWPGTEREESSRRRIRLARTVVGALAVLASLALLVSLAGRRPRRAVIQGAGPPPQEELQVSARGPTVAVLEFRALSDQPDLAWVSTALGELLAAELALEREFRVVPTTTVSRMARELSVSPARWSEPRNLSQIRSSLGTDFVVLGTYLALEDRDETRFRVNLQLWDTRHAEVVSSWTEAAAESQLFGLISLAGAHLREVLGEGAASGRSAGTAYLPKDSGVLRLYFGGLQKLRDLEPVAARALLERAIEAVPEQPFAHLALAEALGSLGYEAQARRSAGRAVELSDALPREERLWIEASYEVAAKRWQQAIERFRALRIFSPGNVEYALQLARAQIRSGRPMDAIETLAESRAGEADLVSWGDARLDVVHAEAALALGHYEEALAATDRAVEWGAARGALLIVANARHAEARALHALGEVGRAETTLEEARLAFVSTSDPHGEALTRVTLAEWLEESGDFSESGQTLERAGAIFRSVGDRSGEAEVLTRQGRLLSRQGRSVEAEELFNDAIERSREIGNRLAEADALHGLGDLLGRSGRLDRARAVFEQALATSRQIGNRELEALMLMNLGKIHMMTGEIPDGIQKLAGSAEAFEEVGRRFRAAQAHCFHGKALQLTADLDGAEQAYLRAVEGAEAIDSSRILACGESGLGGVSLERADFDAARAHSEKALSLRSEMENTAGVVESRMLLVHVALAERRLGEAVEQTRELLEYARSVDYAVAWVETLLLEALITRKATWRRREPCWVRPVRTDNP